MKNYLDNWRLIEGSLIEERINRMPSCLEKDHLFEIRKCYQMKDLNQTNSLYVNIQLVGCIYYAEKIRKIISPFMQKTVI